MRFRKIKNGNNTIRQYKGKPFNKETQYGESDAKAVVRITLSERKRRHMSKHPNDKNTTNPKKGVYWGKRGNSYKGLMEFHKNHIWTYIDADMNKGWVNISGEEE